MTFVESFYDQFKNSYFQSVEQTGLEVNSSICIAGKQITLYFSSENLQEVFIRGVRHLLCHSVATPDLKVYLFDCKQSSVSLPPARKNLEGNHGRLINYSNDEIESCYYFESGSLTMINHKQGEAVYGIQDLQKIHFHEWCFPLRTLYHWWFKRKNLLLLHAGCVEKEGRGVLVVGASGSGKSTLCLQCVKQGYRYLGDDFVLCDPESGMSYSISDTAKIEENALDDMLKELPALSPDRPGEGQKFVAHLYDSYPEQLASETLVRMIVAPTLKLDQEKSLLNSSSVGEMLRYAAPSSIIPLAGSDGLDLRYITKLFGILPGYRLNVGRSRELVVSELETILMEGNAY